MKKLLREAFESGYRFGVNMYLLRPTEPFDKWYKRNKKIIEKSIK